MSFFVKNSNISFTPDFPVNSTLLIPRNRVLFPELKTLDLIKISEFCFLNFFCRYVGGSSYITSAAKLQKQLKFPKTIKDLVLIVQLTCFRGFSECNHVFPANNTKCFNVDFQVSKFRRACRLPLDR